jgi:chromatin structure-remodeling complex protein RSC7
MIDSCHVYILICSPDREDTQPTQSRWMSLGNKTKEIVGGSRVGAAAWGLAWVDTMLELPPEDQGQKLTEARRKLVGVLEQG